MVYASSSNGVKTLRTQDISAPVPNCPDISALVPKCPKDTSALRKTLRHCAIYNRWQKVNGYDLANFS